MSKEVQQPGRISNSFSAEELESLCDGINRLMSGSPDLARKRLSDSPSRTAIAKLYSMRERVRKQLADAKEKIDAQKTGA